MVKLATPISALFGNDSQTWEIIAKSYCLECREENLASKVPKQYVFHFDKDILHPWSEKEKDFIRLAILSKKELKLITFHMSASCSKPILKQGIFYCGGVEFSRQEMLDNVRNNISWLKRCINNRDIEIAVENNNYYPTPAYRYITDAHFICQVILENGLKFLFDLAHAKITAHNKRESYQKYIEELPLGRVIQLHVSKHGINEDDLAYDAHELPDESIFNEVKEIIREFSPEYVTIEYYKDKELLIQLLEQYRQLCQMSTSLSERSEAK